MRRALGAALACGAVALLPATAVASAPTARLQKWDEISSAAFQGGELVALDTETVTVREPGTRGRRGPVAFVYYKTDAVTAGLTASRLRFARASFDTRVAVRTSIGPLSGSQVATDGTDFLVVAGGSGFAPPVIWCCDRLSREVVVQSDGRPDAAVPVAGGIDGVRVRVLMRASDGTVSLLSASPSLLTDPDTPDTTRSEVPLSIRPARGLAAIAEGVVAWADPPSSGVVWTAPPGDAGLGTPAQVRVGGRVLGVWAARGLVVTLTRVGTGLRLVRIDPASGASAVVWRGRRIPRVAVGGGAVVVADGRRILASRSGALRRVAQARGDVAAVAADATRAAWFERLTVRGARVTVARLARVPR